MAPGELSLRLGLDMSRLVSDDAWAALTIGGEARGEPHLGQVAVGEVIRARVNQRLFSDGTVTGTVFWPKQFSCWDDRNRVALARMDDLDPRFAQWQEAWLESEHSVAARGATHYLNVMLVLEQRGSLPAWAADPENPKQADPALVTLTIGRHTFLKL